MNEGLLKKRRVMAGDIPIEKHFSYYVSVHDIDEAKKELELIWNKREPIDWIYHTGEIKLELEEWKHKWIGAPE